MSEFCALPSHTDLCGTCRWTDEGLLPTREESTLRATVQDELTVQLAQLAVQRQEDDHYHAMEVDNAQAQVDPEQQEVLANIYDVGGQAQGQPQEMAPMVLAPQVPVAQEQHALAAQAEEDALRVAQAEDPVLAHFPEVREMREKRRRLDLRETVGGMKILLGELRTPDGLPMPYIWNTSPT